MIQLFSKMELLNRFVFLRHSKLKYNLYTCLFPYFNPEN